jgi:hypothetical protein
MTIIALLLILAHIGIGIFQIALISGKPWGEYAWGGQHKVLPRNLRIGSATSLAIYLLMALVYAEKSGLADTFLSERFADIAIWGITGYLALGILMNGISRSKKERALWTPIVAVLALLSLILATS